MADLNSLQESLDISFNDPSFLEQALVHSSYINENPGCVSDSNERLEFLGDAVLGLIVAEKLYEDFPRFTEGELTRLRAALVRRDTLSRVARSLKLGEYLYLGKGEEASGGRRKSTNLAGALEAVIAAIYLDRGLAAAGDLIWRLFQEELTKILSHGTAADYKSQLQEVIQSRQHQTPAYRVIETEGPDHDKRFVIEVRAGDIVLGRGAGKSKKSAETEAARIALEHLSSSFTE